MYIHRETLLTAYKLMVFLYTCVPNIALEEIFKGNGFLKARFVGFVCICTYTQHIMCVLGSIYIDMRATIHIYVGQGVRN